MSVKCIPPLIPLFMVKLGYTEVYIFLIDCGYLRRFYRVPKINVLSKNIRNCKIFIFSYLKKNHCKLHGHVFIKNL